MDWPQSPAAGFVEAQRYVVADTSVCSEDSWSLGAVYGSVAPQVAVTMQHVHLRMAFEQAHGAFEVLKSVDPVDSGDT